MSCPDIFEKFDEKNNLIKEYKFWKLLVRKKQKKLGSCVIILKRDAYPMSEVLPEEMAEYAIIAKELEGALQKLFQPDVIHHAALMFKDKRVHFHVFPRYQTSKKFEGKEWLDDYQPNFLLQPNLDFTPELLTKLKEQIISSL